MRNKICPMGHDDKNHEMVRERSHMNEKETSPLEKKISSIS